MSLLSRLLGKDRDDRESLRPLWHRAVAVAREPEWYAGGGVADTLAGRFDAITLVLALVLLRMERDPALARPAVWLTEMFVDDMDGQLRESGVGDLVVGKHIGRLMSVLGGRLGAIREALPQGVEALSGVVRRNITLADDARAEAVARRALALWQVLDTTDDARLLAGEIVR